MLEFIVEVYLENHHIVIDLNYCLNKCMLDTDNYTTIKTKQQYHQNSISSTHTHTRRERERKNGIDPKTIHFIDVKNPTIPTRLVMERYDRRSIHKVLRTVGEG